ncbi:hypothetical protein BCR34DRAFT_672976 [Clohesyomyces aquaticus]|uniref:Uncharacterized protein n=1 Tax=Clohesyomyces aquaticus TaxID=1231657 RepID=A0A1Y1ZT71_9PLEO|nr:hypothetical protein BCR34DRAFT_672976 [Clohesyomyces aquaticus]
MTTPSSGNIEALHRQRVKGREIILTEEPRLHLVWLHNRVFIKPLPRYLLSYTFWEQYLDESSERLGESQSTIRKAAMGFLRTYRYLIRHETDFKIARDQGLIPEDVDWSSVCHFIAGLQGINDTVVSQRYCFGELRLTRLNFYAPFFFRKFHFERVHGQYGDFFARLYGPILFALAVVSTMLSAMQVALAAEQLVTVHWAAVWYISRWFSVLCLVGTMVVAGWFIALWLYIFIDEWVYTLRQKAKRRRSHVTRSKC